MKLKASVDFVGYIYFYTDNIFQECLFKKKQSN